MNGADDPCAALAPLPRGLQVCYLSFVLEAEVLNGGLAQFFDNPSGALSTSMAPALRELGAVDAACLFEQAWAIESARPGEADLDDIGHAFVPLAQQLPSLRAYYVRKREDQFFTETP